ncbi:MAG: DUF6483 family protein [Lachnospiraceae bacterium]
MVEQDYITRKIRELVRVLLRMLFNINTETPVPELLQEETSREILNDLLKKVSAGNIDEAENILYGILEKNNYQNLQIALLFYSHLNELSEEYLFEHDFSHEEIKDGLTDLVSRYGLNDMVEVFL